MKKNAWITIGCLLITVTAMSAFLWQKNSTAEIVPTEPVQTAVYADAEPLATVVLETEPEPRTIAPAETEPEPEISIANDAEPTVQENRKMSEPALSQKAKPGKAPVSSEPHMGDVRIVNGEKQVYFLGFGWIKDEGGGNIGTVAEDMYENGNKIGVMGGGATVHGKGDITKQVGIMGAEEPSKESAPPPSAQPEPTGEVIYTELQPPVTKDSTPPPYKPNGEPTNP